MRSTLRQHIRIVDRNAAFTLVELLVVIGVIALLISMLLPALNAARAQARTLRCLSNIRQLGVAATQYALANKQALPAGARSKLKDHNWPQALAPYAGGSNDTTGGLRYPAVYRCPNASFPTQGNYHYTANPIIMPDVERTFAGPKYLYPYRLDRVRPADKIGMFFDGVQSANQGYNCYPAAWAINNGLSSQTAVLIYRENYFTPTRVDSPLAYKPASNVDFIGSVDNAEIRYRELRGKAINVVFADGHAETFKITLNYALKNSTTGAVSTLMQSNLRPRIFDTLSDTRANVKWGVP